MTLPALTVYSAGIGTFSPDWGNGIVQGAALLANLRAFQGLSGMTVWMVGTTAAGDGGQGMFVWNAAATTPDDGGTSAIAVSGVPTGRWIRQNYFGETIRTTATGTNTILLTPIGIPLAAYVNQQMFTFFAAGTTTAASTINISGLGAHRVFLSDGVTLAGNGAIQSGMFTKVAYSAAGDSGAGSFIIIGPAEHPPQIIMSGAPSGLAATSIGNAIPSYNAILVTATTGQATVWENGASIQLTNNLGHAAAVNKVALYTAIEATGATAGDSWAFNPLLRLDAGAIPNQAHQCAEFDVANNTGTDFNDTEASFGPPAVFGLQVTGISTNRCTAAIAILGNIAGVQPMWNRGIVLSNTSVRLAGYQDFTGSTTSLDIWGSHTYGFDTKNAAISGSAIRVAAGHPISSRNVGDSADLALIQLDGSDRVFIGNATSTDVLFLAPNVGPSADNTMTSGKAIARWSAVWAANGAIQTSDPRMKTAIAPLPTILPLVMAIQPKTFKWKSGGKKFVPVTKTHLVRDVEAYDEEVSAVEMVDGVATWVTKTVKHEAPAYDELAVVNPDGTPAIAIIPGRPAVHDAAGRVIRAAVPEQRVRRMHREPRYVMKTETVNELQETPGARTHWGFMAPEVKAAFDGIRMDFGGHVLAEDGTQHLRPDQMIPVLWKAVQELAAEVQALKAAAAGKAPA